MDFLFACSDIFSVQRYSHKTLLKKFENFGGGEFDGYKGRCRG